MLTPDAVIRDAVADERLVRFTPFAPWSGQSRVILMCPPIADVVARARTMNDEQEKKTWAKVEAAFQHFVGGGFIDENFLKQLKDYRHEHWEFRCRKPRPSIRVFGRFAQPDVFVATHACERQRLGGMWSPEFEHEKLVCEQHWTRAGLAEPFTSPPHFQYDAYITANARRKSKP